ncbi:MAG: ParB/RepB/Spo0J family partition protein [Ruminococcaceae bacterium]|nr:ParB/RepB/Spo0J family partition protein [Oscillospiraceae bacterium]
MFSKNENKLMNISVDKIYPNPYQPRKVFNEDEIEKLSESIKENGLLQPVTVRKQGSRYILIAGERRLRAVKRAGLKEIKAIVTECEVKDAAIYALIENIIRKDLGYFEEAEAIERLINEKKLSREEISSRLSMSESSISNKLRLLKLSKGERSIIEKNRLTERHARALLRITDEEDRLRVLEAIIKNGLSVKKTEELINKILFPEIKKTRKLMVPKDIRLFINTIDHAVSTMLTAGIEAKSQKNETEEYIECIVRIPKINKK